MSPSSFFKEINSWQDFVGAIDRLDKKGKGDAFELLTKYFFLLNPRYSFYDNIWLYSFRHTGAIEIFKRTGSIHKLQRAMGHSSLNVSLTYLRGLEIAELKEEDMPLFY